MRWNARRGLLSGTVIWLLAGAPAAAAQREPYEHMQTLTRAIAQIRENYVDTVDYGFLVRAAIDGMLHALDPYCRFVPAEQWSEWYASQHGAYSGVGAVIDIVDEVVTVMTVLPASPAAQHGVMPGDRIVAVDDSATLARDVMEVEAWMLGPEGSSVTLLLERGPRLAPDTVSLSMRREQLEPVAVWRSAMADSATAYVALAQFVPNAAESLRDAVRRHQRDGATRLLLDLRGNPGGSVVAMLEVASLFLPEETIVFRTVGRAADATTDVTTVGRPRFPDLPIVVLIDETSASAAEMLAGALQDHDRALILGRRSFGKGLVQSPFPLPGGDVVWLTTERLTTPSGRSLDRRFVARTRDSTVYRTDGGRPLAPGHGIPPDSTLEDVPPAPLWWTATMSRGLGVTIADSVAQALPDDAETRETWVASPDRWREALLDAFLDRVRTDLGVEPTLDSVTTHLALRWLAMRTAETRWGADVATRLFVAHDADVRAALEVFPRVGQWLRGER